MGFVRRPAQYVEKQNFVSAAGIVLVQKVPAVAPVALTGGTVYITAGTIITIQNFFIIDVSDAAAVVAAGYAAAWWDGVNLNCSVNVGGAANCTCTWVYFA